MQTAADITATALRENLKTVDACIFKVRARSANGKHSPNAAAAYVDALRLCHEQREKGIALGAKGPLWDALKPTPLRDQLVGFTTEQRKEREWKGVFAKFPFPIPFHYSIAAE